MSLNIDVNLETNPIEVLYIFGAGHCGSTLLNLCLDQHSSIIGVSEIKSLNLKRPGWSGDEYALDNKFWSKVDLMMLEKYDVGLKEVNFNLNTLLQSNDFNLNQNKLVFETILDLAGKRIISDASKIPNRLENLLNSKLFKVRVIYLIRDGRAIVHAYRRKYGHWLTGWNNLMGIDRAAKRLMKNYGPENWLTIRYEDMVTDLEGTLKKICSFNKVNFESSMLLPDTSKFNGLGGNRIRKTQIKNIKIDNAWKTEMSTLMRVFTALTVSSFNRRHGYSD